MAAYCRAIYYLDFRWVVVEPTLVLISAPPKALSAFVELEPSQVKSLPQALSEVPCWREALSCINYRVYYSLDVPDASCWQASILLLLKIQSGFDAVEKTTQAMIWFSFCSCSLIIAYFLIAIELIHTVVVQSTGGRAGSPSISQRTNM